MVFTLGAYPPPLGGLSPPTTPGYDNLWNQLIGGCAGAVMRVEWKMVESRRTCCMVNLPQAHDLMDGLRCAKKTFVSVIERHVTSTRQAGRLLLRIAAGGDKPSRQAC